MKFAKVVYLIAGIWGVAALTPMYFLRDMIGRISPPAITHAEYFYGFLGVTLTWQFVFLVIASDPLRYRPIIAISIFEKLGFVAAIGHLFLNGRLTAVEAAIILPDALLALLFLTAFFKTKPNSAHR